MAQLYMNLSVSFIINLMISKYAIYIQYIYTYLRTQCWREVTERWRKVHTKGSSKHLNEENLGDISADGRLILKLNNLRMWIWFNWPRIGSSGKLLWTFEFHNRYISQILKKDSAPWSQSVSWKVINSYRN